MSEKDKYEYLLNKGYTYDPTIGMIRSYTNKILKSKHTAGYYKVTFCIKNKYYEVLGHRFAWYYTHKELPEYIDHIDRNGFNNLLNNLRSVTNAQNAWNVEAKGYYFNKEKKKYQVQICVNNVFKYIGRFDTEKEAKIAYIKAKEVYHKIE